MPVPANNRYLAALSSLLRCLRCGFTEGDGVEGNGERGKGEESHGEAVKGGPRGNEHQWKCIEIRETMWRELDTDATTEGKKKSDTEAREREKGNRTYLISFI